MGGAVYRGMRASCDAREDFCMRRVSKEASEVRAQTRRRCEQLASRRHSAPQSIDARVRYCHLP